jgi:hypothetical protein
MESRSPSSILRGIELIEAYSMRQAHGVEEITRASLETTSGIDSDRASVLLHLLLDVLGAVELLEVENLMSNDVDPGALREAVRQQSLNRVQALRSIGEVEERINARLRRGLDRDET